jgi:ubiquinone/menaquinone biosynthesis C-methylase UbiE
MTTEKDYVLGTHDEEVARLGLQHRVWRPMATAAWKRAGFNAGQTLLDIGCGPGFAALDLAEIVGPAGRVIAMDRSRRFLDVLEAAARQRGLTQLEVRELDLDEQPLPEAGADGAWSRWVFAFVRNPRRLLEQTRTALRPGGVFVSHEYVDYRTWRLSPRREAFEHFVSQVMVSWRESGGEPDIGLDLPRWLEELGFEVRERRPIVESPRPGDFLWQWPRAFVDTGIARLVELGRLTEAQAKAALDAFHEVEADPHGFCVLPTVLETIAVRR